MLGLFHISLRARDISNSGLLTSNQLYIRQQITVSKNLFLIQRRCIHVLLIQRFVNVRSFPHQSYLGSMSSSLKYSGTVNGYRIYEFGFTNMTNELGLTIWVL